MGHQLLHKFFGRRRGELPIEMQDEKMRDSEIADERDLMLGRSQQMRRVVGAQYLGRMRVERDDHRCATRVFGVARRSGDDRLMAEMHTIEDADGEKERPGKLAQFRNRAQDSHRCSRQAPRIRDTSGSVRIRPRMSTGSDVFNSSTVMAPSTLNRPDFTRRKFLRCAPQPSVSPISCA